MFQINILVPFLERMESKCECICSWVVMRECCRMAARLASESSVTTRDCYTELRSEQKKELARRQSNPVPNSVEKSGICLFFT